MSIGLGDLHRLVVHDVIAGGPGLLIELRKARGRNVVTTI